MRPTLLTATVWDRIRERMEKRSMTRWEYAALHRYWRVWRYHRRHAHAHGDRLLRLAEYELVRAVTMAHIAEKWAPAIRTINSAFESTHDAMRRAGRALLPLGRAYAEVKQERLGTTDG